MTQEERWERAYNLLIDYYKKYGNIYVPRGYIVDGVKLGQWLDYQRKGRGTNKITQERINKLNELGMVWELHQMHSFDYYYSLLEKYYKEYGNIDIPCNYEIDGVKLGEWLSRLRHSYKIENNKELTQKELDKLSELGITWEIRNAFSFDYYYSLLKDYYKEYGDINVPREYEKNGILLGRWLGNQREAYKDMNKKTHTITHVITQEEIDKLNELGMIWRFFYTKWTENYMLVVEYYEKYGNIDIPYDYVLNDIYLGYWLSIQRRLYNESKLPKARIIKLNKLGIDWNEENTKILNENISDIEMYNSILNERINYVLSDFIIEGNNKIGSIKKQKQIEKELIKRIWK